MTIELAQLAAGVPFAASLALAGGITTLREGRRRAALNEAMHELRRPLQVLALSLGAGTGSGEAARSSIELTADALERLDREINREVAAAPLTEVRLRPLLEDAVARWRQQARLRGRQLRLELRAGEASVEGNRIQLSQALDNLINNALEHGAGEVIVGSRAAGGFAVLAVVDSGAAAGPGGGGIGARIGGRRRRGHGLRLVRRIAGEHGGGFRFRSGSAGTEACLRLPLLGAGRER